MYIRTDENQLVKNIGGNLFKVVQYFGIGERYVVRSDTIDVPWRIECDPEGVDSILQQYGYDGVEDIDSDSIGERNQIIAECIAETELFEQDTLFEGTKAECKAYLDKLEKEEME